MDKLILISLSLIILAAAGTAQTIRVNPTGVNINSQNPTTVFLTFGQIPAGYVAAEAVWCGELIPATPPALGLQCRPDTIYGSLPARYDRSKPSGNGGFTDVMAIPPSVVRRAYQAAVRGADAGFFYVRRFISTTGGEPDQFVNVTCRMTGGGARVPFALTNVEIKTPGKEPVLFIKAGEKFPDVSTEIRYNGTGRLKGRWELVQPGEEPPGEKDLLTEATLPVEERSSQKRYTQVERFNHFLPPVGKFILKLENTGKIPLSAEGQYILLLRIEAVDDKEGDSNLQVLGVGPGVVHSGAVASFPMPTLKFFVVGKRRENWEETALLLPAEEAVVQTGEPLVFSWQELSGAAVYRLELLDEAEKLMFSALLPSIQTNYRMPSWFGGKFERKRLFWRIVALDSKGTILSRTKSRVIRFG